jgi:hypothetical protein
MAHYALLDENNIVVQVITGVDEDVIQTDLDGTQVGGSSEAWENYYASLPWFQGLTCKRTSYNNNIRKNFAGIGFKYDEDFDAFIPPKKYPSWKLNYETFQWESPIPAPTYEKGYAWIWSEDNLEWVKIAIPN